MNEGDVVDATDEVDGDIVSIGNVESPRDWTYCDGARFGVFVGGIHIYSWF